MGGPETPSKRVWIAHFLFPDENGVVATAERTVTATDEESARAWAAQLAPADEFILTVVPRTDEQFLGQVRQKASRLADDQPFDPSRYDDGIQSKEDP